MLGNRTLTVSPGSGRPGVERRLGRSLLVFVASLLFLSNGRAQEAVRLPSTPESSPASKTTAAAPKKTSSASTTTTTSSEPAASATPAKVSELTKLPIDQLVDMEITSASRRPEKLFETTNAVDVITSEDIERAVGETDDFLERGGMITLPAERNLVRLRINANALRAARLDVSSKLLRVADNKS